MSKYKKLEKDFASKVMNMEDVMSEERARQQRVNDIIIFNMKESIKQIQRGGDT